MAGKSHKRRQMESDGEGNTPSPKSKKRKAASPGPRRRSDRSTKGTGGAVEQLKRVGTAVSLPTQKERPDRFAGEARNPLAPETPGRRTKKASVPSNFHTTLLSTKNIIQQHAAPKARLDNRSGIQAPPSPTRPNTLANGRRIIAEARARRQLEIEAESRRRRHPVDAEKDTSELDLDNPDDQDLVDFPDSDVRLSEDEGGVGDLEDSEDEVNNQGAQDISGDEMMAAPKFRNAKRQQERGESTAVLDEHHARNGRPRPPSPAELLALQQRADEENPIRDPIDDNGGEDNDDHDDDTPKARNKRFTMTVKTDKCTDPTQLRFYPATWKDFIEDCKVETRTYVAIRDPWPRNRRAAIQGFITDCFNMTIQKWKREERRVEKHYYPKHKLSMLSLLFDDIASWRGEIKKAAKITVRSHYDLFPPRNSNMSKAATHRYVKAAADKLITQSVFAHGGRDDEGHTNNFGHPAVRDLLHVFLYGRENRIGNLRPDEFGTRIPNGTLCLAVTAIRCILDGYKIYGTAKFPNFSGDLYHSKWQRFCGLVKQLEQHELHADKLDEMCCEIARTGIVGGGHQDDDYDGNTSNDEYGVVVD